jgi:hypothetical protein
MDRSSAPSRCCNHGTGQLVTDSGYPGNHYRLLPSTHSYSVGRDPLIWTALILSRPWGDCSWFSLSTQDWTAIPGLHSHRDPLAEASIPHLLSQSEEFVLYPSHCALAGRRPDKLGVFLALETSESTVQFPGRK